MAWWPWNWLRRGRRSLDRSIADELDAHIEMAAAGFMSEGMSAIEAHERARREFGSVVEVRQLTREVWRWAWLDQLWEDIRIGVRILWTSPGVSATAMLLIALVIGGNTTVFATVRMVLGSRPPASTWIGWSFSRQYVRRSANRS